jgi:hypothetical protein
MARKQHGKKVCQNNSDENDGDEPDEKPVWAHTRQ